MTRSQYRSACYGTPDTSSLYHLVQDGFVRALELWVSHNPLLFTLANSARSFDRDSLWMRLYYRPSDSRARILIMTKDTYGNDLHYCTPLTNLKAIRNGSSLQLCRVRKEGKYRLWARLNFYLFESKS